MYTGLSLSFCVRDIAQGKVPLEEVRQLITATAIRTEAEWENCLEQYKEIYWSFDPAACERIARLLLAEGKVYQPRLEGYEVHNIADGHWTKDGELIRV